jgi:hypothetical protein
VQGWQFSLTGGVLLTLRETAAAIYTTDANFDVLTTSPNTGLPLPQQVPALTGLAVSSNGALQQDSSSLARLRVTWSAVASEAVRQSGQIEVQVAEIAGGLPTGDWPTIAPVSGSATAADIPGLRIGAAVAVRARAVNTLGMRGPWRTVLHVVAGRRAPVVWRQTTAPAGAPNGDHWFDTDDGNRHYVREGGAWVSVRDSGIAQALTDAAAAQATADGKIDTFWQTSAPGSASEGDIWFDTDDGLKQYRRTSGVWVLAADTRIGQAITDAADAQATADGKVTTFVQTSAPTAEAVGDLWLDTDDGNKLHRWSGSAWVALPVGTGGLAANAASQTFTTTGVSAVTVTGTYFTPDGYASGRNTLVATVSFTAAANGEVVVTADAAGSFVNSTGSVSGGRWSIQIDGGTWDGWKRIEKGIPASASELFAMPTTRRFAVVSGVSYSFSFYASKLNSGDTFTVSNFELVAHVRYR